MQFVRRDWIALAIALLFAATVPAFAMIAVPVWRGMLQGVPELLPTSTQLLFSYYWLALLFPILIVALWAKAPSSRRVLLSIGASAVGAAILLAAIWSVGTPADAILEVIRRG
jgi:hypothetical protein